MKIYKTKTQKLDSSTYSSWYFCDRSSSLHKKGLKRKGKKPLQFFARDIARHKYEQLPNGRYYEYSLTAFSYFKGKPCKYHYVLDENKSRVVVGLELYEDILPNFINTDKLYFDVKGGELTYLKKPQKKSAKAHKQQINKAIESSPTTHRGKDTTDKAMRRQANEKYAKFIDSHNNMEGHLTAQAYIHFVELYNECQRRNITIPYRAKDWLYKIYSNADKPRIQKIYSDDFVAYKKVLERNCFK